MSARGPAKQFDPEVALERAMEIFWAEGYACASLADLLAAMGIARKSFYDTFGSKRALFERSIEQYSVKVVGGMRATLQAPGSPLANIRRVVGSIRDDAATPFAPGCLLGVAMAQCSADDPDLARILRRHVARVEQSFADALARAVEAHELRADLDVRGTARLLTVALQGIRLLGRVTETRELTDGAVAAALAVLDAASPSTATTALS
ncbi:MAG: TetR/AcrR family transcriptional regulator [Acidobacteriota bacterium]